MKLFGLTGGIASGKSTVAALLAEAGIEVIDADLLAREVVARGSAGLLSIVEAFSASVLDSDGALDRARLGQIIFADDDKRRLLNQIVHPLVAELGAARFEQLRNQGHAFAVYEVPLLFENGLDAAMDATMLVTVPEAMQLERLLARDGLDPAAARARIDSQMSLAEKKKRTPYQIDNAGSREQTRAQLREVWERLTKEPLP